MGQAPEGAALQCELCDHRVSWFEIVRRRGTWRGVFWLWIHGYTLVR